MVFGLWRARKPLLVFSWLLTWLHFPISHLRRGIWRFEKDLSQCPILPKCHPSWVNRFLFAPNHPDPFGLDLTPNNRLFLHNLPKGPEKVSTIVSQKRYKDWVEFCRCVHQKKYGYSSFCRFTYKLSRLCVLNWVSGKPKAIW